MQSNFMKPAAWVVLEREVDDYGKSKDNVLDVGCKKTLQLASSLHNYSGVVGISSKLKYAYVANYGPYYPSLSYIGCELLLLDEVKACSLTMLRPCSPTIEHPATSYQPPTTTATMSIHASII